MMANRMDVSTVRRSFMPLAARALGGKIVYAFGRIIPSLSALNCCWSESRLGRSVAQVGKGPDPDRARHLIGITAIIAWEARDEQEHRCSRSAGGVDGAGHARGRAVPHDVGQLGDERGDRD